jgi:peptide/nickel transport system permease protein
MIRYMLKRLSLLLIVLFGVMVLVFAIGRLIPGDPARVMLGERATPEMVKNMRMRLGLNKPIYVQFLLYCGQVLRGDLGNSITQFIPVSAIIGQHFMATFELAIMSILWAVIIGIPVGVLAAVKKNTALDYAPMTLALFGVSMPVFWIGLLLILLFSVKLGWFPASGRSAGVFEGLFALVSRGDSRPILSALSCIILPSLALGSMFAALIARMMRASMLEVLNEQYIETARAKGLRERVVVNKHARRNAMIPIVTVIGMQFGSLLGGAVLTEQVFSWPGLGRTLVEAIFARDYPLFEGIILSTAFLFAVINLIVDLLYLILDPRISYA